MEVADCRFFLQQFNIQNTIVYINRVRWILGVNDISIKNPEHYQSCPMDLRRKRHQYKLQYKYDIYRK